MALTSDPLQTAATYWDAAAETYSQNFSGTTIGRIRRRAVWNVKGGVKIDHLAPR